MTSTPDRSGVLYRRIARAFPHRFRQICGDGLEQLGADIAPLVWREHGVAGMLRLFADLMMQLPYQYFLASTATLKEFIMTGDLFEGTWRAVTGESQWDASYKPDQACLRFEATSMGYLLVAYGIKGGQACAERPTSIVADGRRRPLLDLNGRPIAGVPPGAMAFGSRPDARTLESGAEVDGRVLGKGTYRVSDDGKTLTVTTEGLGLDGPFKTVAVFERIVPDPFLPRR